MARSYDVVKNTPFAKNELYPGSPAGTLQQVLAARAVVDADAGFFASERVQGRYWLNDPFFDGGCVANDISKATANSDAWDALYAAIGAQGAVICVPIAQGGPFWFARQWLIHKRSVSIVGQSSGWRSGEYSDKRQTGSHLRFQLSTGRCIEYRPDPALTATYDGYVTGILAQDFLVTSTGGRDASAVGLYVGTSDHAKILRVAALDCGLAIHAEDCDSPEILACQVCENGNGILVERGFYARALENIAADESGKTGVGPNSGFGLFFLDHRGGVATANIFARNKVSLWAKNSTDLTLGGNSYAETIGVAVKLENSHFCNLLGGVIRDAKDYAVQLIGASDNTIQALTAQTGTAIPNLSMDADSHRNQVLDCKVNVGYLDNDTSGPGGSSTNIIRENFGRPVAKGTGGGGTGGSTSPGGSGGTPLAAPANFTLSPTASTFITASWDAVPKASSYQVQLAKDAAFTTGLVTVTVSATSQVFTGLAPATPYYGRAATLASGATTSAYSATSQATTKAAATQANQRYQFTDNSQTVTPGSNATLAALFAQPWTLIWNSAMLNDDPGLTRLWVISLGDGTGAGRRVDVLTDLSNGRVLKVQLTDAQGNYFQRQFDCSASSGANHVLRWDGGTTAGSLSLLRNGQASPVQGDAVHGTYVPGNTEGVLRIGSVLDGSSKDLYSSLVTLDDLYFVAGYLTDAQIGEIYPSKSAQISFANQVQAYYTFDGDLKDQTGKHDATAAAQQYAT